MLVLSNRGSLARSLAWSEDRSILLEQRQKEQV